MTIFGSSAITPRRIRRKHGTVLLLTLMMLVMLTFEVAMISLVAQRGLSEEGMLASQNITARRGGEVALNRLQENLYTYMLSGTAAHAETAFAFGGPNDIYNTTLTITNPSSGASENTDVTMWAWVKERRGSWFHLVGRAQNGTVDLMVHRWVYLNPCNMTVGGTLSTILTGIKDPGLNAIAVSPDDGRLFFTADTATDPFWTWHEDTGLSTLLTGKTLPGYNSMTIANDGRVFFGEDSGSGQFRTWKAGILSTIISASKQRPGMYSAVVGNDGRVFLGERDSPGGFWTWKAGTGAGTGLSTIPIASTPDQPGTSDQGVIAIHKSTSRVYFGEEEGGANDRLWSWHANTGLSTIIEPGMGAYQPGHGMPREAAPDGSILFGEEGSCTTCTLWTWKPGVGLSIIVDTGVAMKEAFSHHPVTITQDSRFYFGTEAGGYFTWKADGTAAGSLSTIMAGGSPGQYSSGIDSTGRVFFPSASGGSRMHTYHPLTGLSTIHTGQSSLHNYGARSVENFYESKWVTPSGRAFWGQEVATTGKFWTYHVDTGLSTILTGSDSPGAQGAIAVTDNERVYIGSQAASANIWTWHKTTGLSTLATGGVFTGENSTGVTPNGRMYMGGWSNGGTDAMRTWSPPPDCNNLPY